MQETDFINTYYKKIPPVQLVFSSQTSDTHENNTGVPNTILLVQRCYCFVLIICPGTFSAH